MLKYGMIGGGPDAFVGQVHRRALALNQDAELVAGCFSRDLDKTLETGLDLGLNRERLYPSIEDMAANEAGNLDFVVVVTSNEAHYTATKACLEQGISVMCDKPFTITSQQAAELVDLARRNDLHLGVSYTYGGYAMVRQAREMVARGDIGKVRFVNCEYPQGWLDTLLENTGHVQAGWRADPDRGGPTLSLGDVGTHVEFLVPFVTGLKMTRLCARLDAIVPGRKMDDNGTILTEYEGGARGMYWYSQAATGCVNGLKLRVFGDKGSIEWYQEDMDHLLFTPQGKPTQHLVRGMPEMLPGVLPYSHTPAGHPEGWLMAFANTYSAWCRALKGEAPDYPTGQDGLRGVRFIEACVESSENDSKWMDFKG